MNKPDYNLCTDTELFGLKRLTEIFNEKGFTVHYQQCPSAGRYYFDPLSQITLLGKSMIADFIKVGFHEIWLEGKCFLQKIGAGKNLTEALIQAELSIEPIFHYEKLFPSGNFNDEPVPLEEEENK